MKKPKLRDALLLTTLWMGTAYGTPAMAAEPYWGDTHVHTTYSMDAFMFGTNIDPSAAYRFARGVPVIQPVTGAWIQIRRPLDFIVISDHAEMLGVAAGVATEDPLISSTSTGQKYIQWFKEGRLGEIYSDFIRALVGSNDTDVNDNRIKKSIWSRVADAADLNNLPGKFTAFTGWEWTSNTNGANLHRVVFTPTDASTAKQFTPYSAFDSDKPEDLWKWLTKTRKETGADFVAIPHNSNVSKGKMFDMADSEGRPISAEYARNRMMWEVAAEVTQIKGTSETHPALSPTDEFAGFELFTTLLQGRKDGVKELAKASEADYLRSALKRGMEIQQKTGVNPYKVGLIGSSDTHTGLVSSDEDEFYGKSVIDMLPADKGKEFPGVPTNGWEMSASGLAAVWATENTREAIFAAFKRREVYATTGPRITLRFFGGFGFNTEDASAADIASVGYARGVPMGGDLLRAPKGKVPSFLVHAVRDPIGANLDRVQIIKGWVDAGGKAQERIYDVAWSGNRAMDVNGKLEAVGNTVDTESVRYSNSIGSPQLSRVWVDPDFNPSETAFYYVRVLQIPTPRSSLYDAKALQIDHAETGQPASIQERAYSSPIWYNPK